MHPFRRPLLVLLSAAIAAIAAVLALALPAAAASTAAVPAARNGVGASHPAIVSAIGASRPVSPAQGRCETVLQARFAVGACVAAEGGGQFVNLASEARTNHILNGEVRPNGTFGGGHRFGTGFPGKSEFPANWSDQQIMHNISDVATDPSLAWRSGDRPGDFFVNGTCDGVDVEVLIRNGEIWTGYPTNLARNP